MIGIVIASSSRLSSIGCASSSACRPSSASSPRSSSCSAAWVPAATGCVRAGASSPPVEHRAPDRQRVGRAPLRQVVVRAVKNFLAHQMTDRAATLTYYAMMSLFPALLVGVTLLGLVGQQGLVTDATNYLLDHGVDAGDRERHPQGPAEHGQRLGRNARDHPGGLGAARAQRRVGRLRRGRAARSTSSTASRRAAGWCAASSPTSAATLVVIVLFSVVLASIFLGGQIADDLFGKIGLGSTAATIWSYARWPVALVAATVAYGIVYGLAPDIEPRQVRWITPGAVVGVVLWIALSLGFSIYVRNFSSYGAVYGAFAAAIVLLLWLYLSANAFLFGAELNAELERRPRAIRPAARQLAVRELGRVGAQARPARAGRAQPAMRDLGDRVRAGQQRRRGVAQLALERLGVGLLVADHGRLAGALEEEVGDLDGRRARAQRGERVDAPLRGVVGLDERLEVGVADAVGLVVDDQRGAVGLVGDDVDEAVEQRPVGQREGEGVLAVHGPRGAQPLAQGAAGEGGDHRPQVGHVGVGQLGVVRGGDGAHRLGVRQRGAGAQVEVLQQRVHERAAHAQVEARAPARRRRAGARAAPARAAPGRARGGSGRGTARSA